MLLEINAFSNNFTFGLDSTTLFRSLKTSPEFRERFVLSFMDMLNNNFAPAMWRKCWPTTATRWTGWTASS